MAFFCANLEGSLTKIQKISGTTNSQIFLDALFFFAKKPNNWHPFYHCVQLQRKTVHIHSFMLHWKSNHVRNSKLLLQWEFCSQSTLPRDYQLSMYYVIKILVFCTPLPSHLWLYFKHWTDVIKKLPFTDLPTLFDYVICTWMFPSLSIPNVAIKYGNIRLQITYQMITMQ